MLHVRNCEVIFDAYLFLYFIPNLITNPLGSNFKIYPKFNHFSLWSLLPLRDLSHHHPLTGILWQPPNKSPCFHHYSLPLQCTVNLFFTQQHDHHIVLIKTIQWFSILFRVKSKILAKATRLSLTWSLDIYVISYSIALPIACFASATLVSLVDLNTSSMFLFCIFVLAVSSAGDAHTLEVYMTGFSYHICAEMSSLWRHPCPYPIQNNTIIFNVLFCLIFLCITYKKKYILYANFLPSPFQNEGSSRARTFLLNAAFLAARRVPDT